MRFTKLVHVRQIHVYALLTKYEQNVALNHFIACFSYNVICMKIQSILARWLYIPQAIQLMVAPYTLEPSQLESFIANPAFVTLETCVVIRRLSALSLSRWFRPYVKVGACSNGVLNTTFLLTGQGNVWPWPVTVPDSP